MEFATEMEKTRAMLRVKKGGVTIEMIFIILLMIMFIVFTIIALQWLSHQGRILAAGRTATWLAAHAEEPQAAADTISSVDFAKNLQEWHFRSMGVVQVGTMELSEDLLLSDAVATIFTQIREIGRTFGKEPDPEVEKDPDNRLSGSFGESKPYSEVDAIADSEKETATETSSAFSGPGQMFEAFLKGIGRFLSKDFKTCAIRVDYWAPMPFKSAMLAKLFGGETSAGGEGSGSQASFEAMGTAGSEYALLTRGTHTTCIMPILDPGAEGGIGDALQTAADKATEMMNKVKDAMKGTSEEDLYRPMKGSLHSKFPEDEADMVMEHEFYALLVYELKDDRQTEARK